MIATDKKAINCEENTPDLGSGKIFQWLGTAARKTSIFVLKFSMKCKVALFPLLSLKIILSDNYIYWAPFDVVDELPLQAALRSFQQKNTIYKDIFRIGVSRSTESAKRIS
mmetsp:Transcript_13686/g.24541  ORF Transcript_13686/g.24541 Transcript_13686/m.24541 type:complete len:111 (-) Transcript_13686:299-631(-)